MQETPGIPTLVYNGVGCLTTFSVYLNAAQQDMADAMEAEDKEKAAKKSAILSRVAQQNAHSSQMEFNEGMTIMRWKEELAQEVAYEGAADERRMTHLKQEINRYAQKTRVLQDELFVLANKQHVLQQKKVQDEIDTKRAVAREVRQQERKDQLEARKRDRAGQEEEKEGRKKLTSAARRKLLTLRAKGGIQPDNNSDSD